MHHSRRQSPAKRELDSHQIVGILVICGVLAGLIGFALGRFDVIFAVGFAISVAFAITQTRKPKSGRDAGFLDDTRYDSDGGGCGGDGGGD